MVDFVVAQCANRIEYQCGCKAEYQLVGQFAHIPEWHIIPCYAHAQQREKIEDQVNIDWERITSEVRS